MRVTDHMVEAAVAEGERLGMLNLGTGRARRIITAAIAAASRHTHATQPRADRDLDGWDGYTGYERDYP